MAVTILALMLLRIGIHRARARRWQLKSLKSSDQNVASAATSPIETLSPTETSTPTETSSTTTATIWTRCRRCCLEP
jgi:hypothetical protein